MRMISTFSKAPRSGSNLTLGVNNKAKQENNENQTGQQQAGSLEYRDNQILIKGMSIETDEARSLLEDYANGDTDAFWKLWVLYKSHLYHLCLWQMDGMREDAEDALSRVMLKAHEKLPHNAHQIQNVRAWLSKLTLNLCIDVHRERKRQLRRIESIDDGRTEAVNLVRAVGDSPEDYFLTQEEFSDVCEAVDELPDRLREPFLLRFFQEMTYDEIADRLVLSAENVRKRIQQAREILKHRSKTSCGARRASAWRKQCQAIAEAAV